MIPRCNGFLRPASMAGIVVRGAVGVAAQPPKVTVTGGKRTVARSTVNGALRAADGHPDLQGTWDFAQL